MPGLDRVHVVSMIDKRRVQHLIGETLREFGVLLALFFPLDAFFQSGLVSPLVLATGVAGGLLFVTVGIIVESSV